MRLKKHFFTKKNRARHIYKLLKICKYDGLGPPNKDHINSANFYESIKNQQFLYYNEGTSREYFLRLLSELTESFCAFAIPSFIKLVENDIS